MKSSAPPFERTHPIDIMRFAVSGVDAGVPVALIFVTNVVGGAVRMPGLRMAVRADGSAIGYVSSGCIERDIISQATAALADGQHRRLRYGAGSVAVDLRLPCGGQIDLMIVPHVDRPAVQGAISALAERRAVAMTLSDDGILRTGDAEGLAESPGFRFRAIPKLRVRIIGTGAETIILARLAMGADMDVTVQSPDAATVAAVAQYGGAAQLLVGLSGNNADHVGGHDDEWTACAILFHDHEWETKLLPAMLAGDAFYVGALGSYRAHQARCAALTAAGLTPEQIDRIRAPIGLVAQLRDAPLLAVSVLAEITRDFQARHGHF